MDERTTPLPPPAAGPDPASAFDAPTLPPPGATVLAAPPTAPAPTLQAPTLQAPTLQAPTLQEPTAPAIGLPDPAPGTPWAPGGPLPSTIVEPVPVATPTRSRGPLLLAVGVLATVALAIGAFFVFAGSGGDGDEVATVDVSTPDTPENPGIPAEAFSLAAASTEASSATAFRYDMVMSVPFLGEMTVDGAIDQASGRMSMQMDMGDFAGGFGTEGVDPADMAIEMVLDAEGGVMYMGGPAATQFGVQGVEWVSLDLTEFADMSGQSLEELRTDFMTNPADVADLFDGVDAVEVGMDTIDGVPVKHYRITVAIEDALAADPTVADQLGPMADEFEDITYDVWVTEDNHLRRLSFDVEFDGMAMSAELNIHEVAEAIDIPLPDPADVQSMDELLGSFGGFPQD